MQLLAVVVVFNADASAGSVDPMSALGQKLTSLLRSEKFAKCHKRTSTAARPNLTNSPKS